MFHYGLRLLVLKIRINSVKSFNLHHQWKARFEKCRFTHLCPCQTWAKENSEQENSARFHFKVSALPREMESNLTGLKRVEFKPSKNWHWTCKGRGCTTKNSKRQLKFFIKDEVHFGSVAQREMIKGSNVPRVKDVTKEPPEDL